MFRPIALKQLISLTTIDTAGDVPGFESRLLKGFLCLVFYFVFVVVFLVLVKNTLFVTTFCNFVCNSNLFSIATFVTDYKCIKIQT